MAAEVTVSRVADCIGSLAMTLAWWASPARSAACARVP